MNKTDKELAVEFAIAYISSWNSTEGTQPIQQTPAIDILRQAYETISRFGYTE